jgi:hypothetical protein
LEEPEAARHASAWHIRLAARRGILNRTVERAAGRPLVTGLQPAGNRRYDERCSVVEQIAHAEIHARVYRTLVDVDSVYDRGDDPVMYRRVFAAQPLERNVSRADSWIVPRQGR